jgi:quinone-modifying oxidoreductase subunit QmoC
LKRFLADIHANALAEGKTDKQTLEPAGMIQALLRVIPKILAHAKFKECGENKERALAHQLTLFAFIGLFIVTSVIFLVLYGSYLAPGGPLHGPWSQTNPIKWLANLSGVALIVGTALMIKSRRSKPDQKSAYKDWFLIYLALGLGVTGMLTELTRIAGWAPVSFFLYFLHLINVFFLIAYLPFTKLAHLVYRTAAMTYAEYAGRK